jgi:hypothetical protein
MVQGGRRLLAFVHCGLASSRTPPRISGVILVLLLFFGWGTNCSYASEFFRTPSGRIFCSYDDASAQYGIPDAIVRCDIFVPGLRTPKPPADCPLSWGDAFTITASGRRGSLFCHGDTTRNPEAPVVPYGRVWRRGGFACKSEPTGLTCTNGLGHGFRLSWARQDMF